MSRVSGAEKGEGMIEESEMELHPVGKVGKLGEDQRATGVRCISLTQPWASLIAIGVKSTETRSWRTWYRGPLLIHAAKGFPRWARDLCNREPFATVLLEAGYADPGSSQVDPAQLPLGAILAVCNVTTPQP